MKNKLLFSEGGKGGVGKTFVMAGGADYLSNNGIPYRAYDGDGENRGKASSFASLCKEAQAVDIKSIRDLDALLESAAENTITLLDLPANASADFLSWFDEVADADTLEALNLELIGIGVITPEPGTFASVVEWAMRLQDRAKYIVALNQRSAKYTTLKKEELFYEYYNSKAGDEFRKHFQPKELLIPSLYEGTAAEWLKAKGLPSDLIASQQLPLLHRSRLRQWVTKIHSQLAEILDLTEEAED